MNWLLRALARLGWQRAVTDLEDKFYGWSIAALQSSNSRRVSGSFANASSRGRSDAARLRRAKRSMVVAICLIAFLCSGHHASAMVSAPLEIENRRFAKVDGCSGDDKSAMQFDVAAFIYAVRKYVAEPGEIRVRKAGNVEVVPFGVEDQRVSAPAFDFLNEQRINFTVTLCGQFPDMYFLDAEWMLKKDDGKYSVDATGSFGPGSFFFEYKYTIEDGNPTDRLTIGLFDHTDMDVVHLKSGKTIVVKVMTSGITPEQLRRIRGETQ